MITKNLRVTITDHSDMSSGIKTPGVHLSTTDDGSVMIEAVSNRVPVVLEDLKEALKELELFNNMNKPLTTTAKVVPATLAVEYGDDEASNS